MTLLGGAWRTLLWYIASRRTHVRSVVAWALYSAHAKTDHRPVTPRRTNKAAKVLEYRRSSAQRDEHMTATRHSGLVPLSVSTEAPNRERARPALVLKLIPRRGHTISHEGTPCIWQRPLQTNNTLLTGSVSAGVSLNLDPAVS